MIIGLSGWARAGKDTVADHLEKNYGFTKLSFATPMRDALVALDPVINIAGQYVSLAQAVRLSGWENLKSMSNDIRPLMQRLGTEVGRNMFGENFWVNLAMQEAEKYENVVFADCRFKNEANAIKEAGGQLWRVMRPGFLAANDHISENDLNSYLFDEYLSNSSDFSGLYEQVNEVMLQTDALKLF
jgi:hypothetical protein